MLTISSISSSVNSCHALDDLYVTVTRACTRGKDRVGTLAGEKSEHWVAIVAGAVAGGCAHYAPSRERSDPMLGDPCSPRAGAAPSPDELEKPLETRNFVSEREV